MIYQYRPSNDILIAITLKEAPEAEEVVLVRQVHGNRIIEVSEPFDDPPEADGLTTLRGDLPVGVLTADCLPILYRDDKRIAALHAGWRGLAEGIIPTFLELVPEPAIGAFFIGPAIGPCCYTIGEDVARHFPGFVQGGHLDLRRAAVAQMTTAGVKEERITHLPWCTFCHPSHLPSYRREGAVASRIVTFIKRLT